MSDDLPKALLAGVQLPSDSLEELDSIRELSALAATAGTQVVGEFIQRRSTLDPATLVGSGKVRELADAVSKTGAELVIFSTELTSGQQARLEESLAAKVTDRTALILEIFAQHATTREGRTQVELAQLSYMLPRIRGKGLELSRIGGGIGTRMGGGETQLEVDRRTLRRRMRKLERDLDQMEAVRSTQSKRRSRAGLEQVSLVGYTNSGKSSLLNALTGASVLVEDRLFSTLDSTTRRLSLPGGRDVVLSDTVGFIRRLPHELVAAFRSTLEVVRDADLLLHVVDASDPDAIVERIDAVRAVLEEIGAWEVPRIEVLNKTDLLDPAGRAQVSKIRPGAILVSATTGEGIDDLLSSTRGGLRARERVSLFVPSSRGDVIASVYREGRVFSLETDSGVTRLDAELPHDRLGEFGPYLRQRMPENGQ